MQNPSHAKDAAPATKSVADKALDVVAAEAAAELAEHHLIATAAKYRLNNGDKASVADLILAATAAAAADSALVAARDHKDYELVEETNSLQKIFCPREKDKVTGKEKESRRWIFWGLKCCWRGTWANVTPHRKLDFLFAGACLCDALLTTMPAACRCISCNLLPTPFSFCSMHVLRLHSCDYFVLLRAALALHLRQQARDELVLEWRILLRAHVSRVR